MIYLICKEEGQDTAREGKSIEANETAEEKAQGKVVLVVLRISGIQSEGGRE